MAEGAVPDRTALHLLRPATLPSPTLTRDFFARSVHEVAPELIGVTLLVAGVGGRIVEVEAYDRDDPASHAYRRPDAAQHLDVRPRRAMRTCTAPTGCTGA